MVSTNPITGVSVKSITYTLQREGGSVHQVQVDPVDSVLHCSCTAGIYGRTCWAMRLVRDGRGGKPRVRVTVRRPLPPVRRARRSDAMVETITALEV